MKAQNLHICGVCGTEVSPSCISSSCLTSDDASVQERLNRMQAERDELRSCCDKLAAEVRQQVEDFGKLRVERDHLLAELVAARRGSAGEDDCCNGDGFCPLCDKGRA